jgi:antitoxin component of RelBE/YafQ-DinJ toxin-antitoxin module
MGRPKKGDEALNNDIKVRIDDKALSELDKYCELNSCTRSEALRQGLTDLVKARNVPETVLDAKNDATYCIEQATRYLDYAAELIKIALEQGGLSNHGNEILIKNYLEDYKAIDNSKVIKVLNDAISELNK